MAQAGSRSTGAQSTPSPAAQTQTSTPAAKTTTDSTPPAAATTAAGTGSTPAGVAIRDAARAAEMKQLTKQRDELRELLGGDAPDLEVLRAEVSALQHAAAKAGVTGTHRFTMSAGVAADLETRGFAVDGTNGDAYVRDGDRVKVTSRTGKTRTVDMPGPSGAGEAKPAGKN